ncbi:RNA polymerase ECF-type sigma factor [Filimonas lacunae]|nr:RNA polymerase ECF-type sigma factor [Filimonas lacunae]
MAFEILYRRLWVEMYDTAYQRLKNDAQAEDIVQDVFTSLWTRRASLNIDNVTGYLHTAVRFKVFNYVQRGAAHSFLEPFQSLASPANADDKLLEKELSALLAAYEAALPDKRRKIFQLYFHERLSTREIADMLDISQKTVQNQLGTTLQDLRAGVLPLLILLTSTLK